MSWFDRVDNYDDQSNQAAEAAALAIALEIQTSIGLSQRAASESVLRQALEQCADADSLIPREHARIAARIEKTTVPGEIEALEYQRDLIGWSLSQAARVARWRLAHLNTLVSVKKWEAEKACCTSPALTWRDPLGHERTTSGLLYWFAMWAWTYDPRRLLKTLPFYLFPVQEKALLAVNDAVFVDHTSILIDKSRDMGVTWLMACWDVYHWLFTPGFAALLGNRTEDEVDEGQGNMDATFNKIRFQVKLLPKQLLPPNFNERKHMTFMSLSNPDNGANLSGRAPVADFGRGARRTVIQPDEFASWVNSKGYKQYQACSQTSDSMVITSTVKGIFNKYGELLLDENMPKVILDWRDHPWKDDRWYRALPTKYLGPPMSKTDIAQEVDRDPYASQPGQVLTQYSPIHNIITYSEFWRIYGRTADVFHLERKVPLPGWNVSAGQDVGTSDDHPNVTTYLTRPKENHPYPEFIFCIKEIVRIKLSSIQIAEGVKDEYGRVLIPGFQQYEESALRGNTITQRILSHEASNEQLCYQRDCKLYPTSWGKWPGDSIGGIEQWDNALTLNMGIRNPFVIDPRTSDPRGLWAPFIPTHYCTLCGSDHPGEHLQGCGSWFFLVPDNEGALYVDESGKLKRLPAKTDLGFERGTKEVLGWHYPESERGKAVKERKPEKAFNDFCDSVRMQMAYFALTSAGSTKEEKIEAALPEEYRTNALDALVGTPEHGIAAMGRYFNWYEAKSRVEREEIAGSGLNLYEQSRLDQS